MTIQPVENTPQPGYPDKHRWLAAPLVAGMLSAAVALGFSGCGAAAEHRTEGEPAMAPTVVITEDYLTMGETTTARLTQSETTTFVNMGTSAAPIPVSGDIG